MKTLGQFIKEYNEANPSSPIIEIPFGARDSESIEEVITIPEGYYVIIKGNKIIIRRDEQER